MPPTEGEFISQEALQTTFQLHTPMSIKEPTNHPITWPTLSQPLSLQSQPQSSTKGTSMMAPQIGSHGLQENSISYENWSTCQHRSNQKSSYISMQAYYLPTLCSMSV